LISTEEFGQIIVKTGPNGEKTLLKDVARVELSADSYALRSLLNNKTAVALPIFQTPGANALELSASVRRTMEELKKNFPDGVDYSVVYDPTVFVRHSIEAVVHTLGEVTRPIIATALVLCAVFVPTAFISGLTGQFYKQFAITIAISTVISAFNSLTLSPALCAVLLKEHSAPKDWFARVMEKSLGWFFHPFNRVFAWAGNKYSTGVGSVLRKSAVALIVYGGLVLLTGWSFNKVPTGFVPTQ